MGIKTQVLPSFNEKNLDEEDSWMWSREDIVSHIKEYYKRIFTSSNPFIPNNLDDLCQESITAD